MHSLASGQQNREIALPAALQPGLRLGFGCWPQAGQERVRSWIMHVP